jgi:hypothetical protein
LAEREKLEFGRECEFVLTLPLFALFLVYFHQERYIMHI